MFLAGDIGGTNTRLARVRVQDGVFEVADVAVYPSASAPSLAPLLRRYLDEYPGTIRGAGFGIAGPVTGALVRLTNLPWEIDRDVLARLLGVPVVLVNDLAAAAHGILGMPADRLLTLQPGFPMPGNRAVIAAGTGLGEGLLFWHGGTWHPSGSEGGHASFAPGDEEEIELLRFAAARFGHVSYERILSGPGIALLYEFYRARAGLTEPPPWPAGREAPFVTDAALGGTDPHAVAALSRFCSIYGAEAGNLALKVLATGGVFVAGGIAPKILPFLRRPEFLSAFLDKGRYAETLARIPVQLVLDDLVGLRGAARAAFLETSA